MHQTVTILTPHLGERWLPDCCNPYPYASGKGDYQTVTILTPTRWGKLVLAVVTLTPTPWEGWVRDCCYTYLHTLGKVVIYGNFFFLWQPDSSPTGLELFFYCPSPPTVGLVLVLEGGYRKLSSMAINCLIIWTHPKGCIALLAAFSGIFSAGVLKDIRGGSFNFWGGGLKILSMQFFFVNVEKIFFPYKSAAKDILPRLGLCLAYRCSARYYSPKVRIRVKVQRTILFSKG